MLQISWEISMDLLCGYCCSWWLFGSHCVALPIIKLRYHEGGNHTTVFVQCGMDKPRAGGTVCDWLMVCHDQADILTMAAPVIYKINLSLSTDHTVWICYLKRWFPIGSGEYKWLPLSSRGSNPFEFRLYSDWNINGMVVELCSFHRRESDMLGVWHFYV